MWENEIMRLNEEPRTANRETASVPCVTLARMRRWLLSLAGRHPAGRSLGVFAPRPSTLLSTTLSLSKGRSGRRRSAIALASVIAGSAVLSAQSTPPRPRGATAADARKFLADVNQELLRLINDGNRAGWVQSTYITPDTEVLAAQANEQLVNAVTRYAKEARRFDKVALSPAERRQFDVLKNSLTISAPPDPKEAEEVTRIVASMEGAYGSGKYCPNGASAS